MLHTSGRVLSGAVTVVFGGATLIYDIYRLNQEVQTLAGKGKDGAADIRFVMQPQILIVVQRQCQERRSQDNTLLGEQLKRRKNKKLLY